jgi:hypothetical protein
MSVKNSLGLVLYSYLNMPNINKTYLILSILSIVPVAVLFFIQTFKVHSVYPVIQVDQQPPRANCDKFSVNETN